MRAILKKVCLGFVSISVIWSLTVQASESPLNYNNNYDLVIINGKVVDGTESVATETDIVINGDTILYIGNVEKSQIKAKRIIDAQDKFVSPGFIDTHAHGNVLDSKYSYENFIAQGVTTIVLGQDGETPGSVYPTPLSFEGWVKAVENNGVQLNVAALIGHGTIRNLSDIRNNPEPSKEKLVLMGDLLKNGMELGANGFAQFLGYIVQCFASIRWCC